MQGVDIGAAAYHQRVQTRLVHRFRGAHPQRRGAISASPPERSSARQSARPVRAGDAYGYAARHGRGQDSRNFSASKVVSLRDQLVWG